MIQFEDVKILNKSTFTKWEQWVYVIVVVLIIGFFWYTSPKEVEVKENISIVETHITCDVPIFNYTSGYWFCNIDDFNYTEVRS